MWRGRRRSTERRPQRRPPRSSDADLQPRARSADRQSLPRRFDPKPTLPRESPHDDSVTPYESLSLLLPRINTIVAELLQSAGSCWTASNFQPITADFTAEGVPVNAKKIGGAQLISVGRGKDCVDQRDFDIAQHALVEAIGGQAIAELRKITGEMDLHERRDRVLGGELRPVAVILCR